MPFAKAQLVHDRGQDRISAVQPGDFVRDQRGEKARCRIAVGAGQQRGRPGRGLDHVVIGLEIGIRPVGTKPDAVNIDNVGPDRAHRVIANAQPLHRLAPDIVDEHVGLGQLAFERGLALARLEIDRE